MQKLCHQQEIPYELYVIVYDNPSALPRIFHQSNFAAIVNKLTLDNLLSVEVPLAVS